MRRSSVAGRLALAVAILLLTVSTSGWAAQEGANAEPAEIVMVTWRGCEDACQGFQDYIAASEVEAIVTVLDAGRDRSLLPGFVDQVIEMRPDLLVTWGTSVTLGMVGTIDGDGSGMVTGISTVFMIVADPVGARIIEEYSRSGRPDVTGTHNRVPEATQLRVLADYLPFERLGMVYNDDELNAVLKADEIKRVGRQQGFEVVERVLATDVEGSPLVEDIATAVADIASRDVDLIYLGSSSFLLENADAFTGAALEHGLPVATSYEAMVRDSHALIALASAYYNVGQLAGYQAERVLGDGQRPGDLDVLGLDRYSVLINIETARVLDLYPPMLLLRYAEIVGRSK
jgi:putative ABC transport system substrate-binding protein